MKTTAILYQFFASVFLLFLFGCPNSINNPDIDEINARTACEKFNNYIYQNGDCICPEEYFEVGTEITNYSCRENRRGAFLMTSDDCSCGSTFVFEMKVDDTTRYRDVSLFYDGNDQLSFPDGASYQELPDGDEVTIVGTVDLKCQDGEQYPIQMYGKLNPEKTSMDAMVIFMELIGGGYTGVDTCYYTLRN